MKQYLTPEQTAKLIELGFDNPKSIVEGKLYSDIYFAYSIGELIEMLQKRVYQIEDSGIPCDLNIHYDGGTWLIVVISERDGRFKTEMFELIDALYLMLVKLKEEGVI
jgi:hypothetical protein